MENNDDCASEVLEHTKPSVKNNSESNNPSESLTVIPDDESADLHITGFKIGLNDEEYYFTLEKARRRSDNAFRILTGRNELIHGTSSSDNQDNSHRLKSKSLSPCKTSKGESLPYASSDMEDQPAYITEKNQNTFIPHRFKRVEDSPSVQLKYITTKGTQTEEITSSREPRTIEDISRLRPADDASTQTKCTRDIWTQTDEKTVESAKAGTDQTIECQTANEILAESSQMKNLAIVSAGTEQDASTQTKRTVNIETSTNFDIYTEGKIRTIDKSAVMEDLLHDSLLLAKAEGVDTQNNEDHSKNCHCFHEYKKQKDFICCCHTMHTEKILENVYFRHNPEKESSSSKNVCHECLSCHSKLKRNCEYAERNDNILDEDIVQDSCNSSKNPESGKFSRTDKNVIEKIKSPKAMALDIKDFSSLTIQEKLRDRLQMEIVKDLKFEFGKPEFFFAVKLFKSVDVERVDALQTPVTITHFLKSFRLARSGSFKVTVNPVDIDVTDSTETSDTLEEEKNRTKPKSDSKTMAESERSMLLISDKNSKKSILVSCILPTESGSDNIHPRICLCSECYSCVQKVVQNQQDEFLHKDMAAVREKMESNKGQPSMILPMIKHKDFDYSSKEAWKPHERKNDEFEYRKTAVADITDIIQSSSEESLERDGNMWFSDACEIVNDHLLDLRPVDEDKLQKAAKILHKRWFEVAGTKISNVQEVRLHIQYFQEFSFNMLKTLLHSVDNNGNNVLHFAFANNRFDLVEELLQQSGFTRELLNKRNKVLNNRFSSTWIGRSCPAASEKSRFNTSRLLFLMRLCQEHCYCC